MTFKVQITDTTTGETRVLEWHDVAPEYATDAHQQFWWSRGSGNGGCDCNRGQFFAEAGGMDTDALTDEEDAAMFPCGHQRYAVPYLEWEDGRRTLIDDK